MRVLVWRGLTKTGPAQALVVAPPPARFVVAVRGRVGVVGEGGACVLAML